jgi:hypothetical protein
MAGPPGYTGWQIDSLESIPELLKRLQIRALEIVAEYLWRTAGLL